MDRISGKVMLFNTEKARQKRGRYPFSACNKFSYPKDTTQSNEEYTGGGGAGFAGNVRIWTLHFVMCGGHVRKQGSIRDKPRNMQRIPKFKFVIGINSMLLSVFPTVSQECAVNCS